MARFNTLDEWLQWQESLHPSTIDLGLGRVREVLDRLALKTRNFQLITVAGTNGKGSSVAMLESILLAAGYRVGTYSSPHLFTYNERIRLDGHAVSDDMICDAFDHVDQARQSTSLTYFEFGTLAAIDIFYRAPLDVVILEVGLGGRLDATNVLDADVALVTTIDIDHVEWLGSDREAIGFEKAGIFRSEKAAVCGDINPPKSLLSHADSIGASLYRAGVDFELSDHAEGWSWQGRRARIEGLPLPSLKGVFQKQNAAAVLMVLEQLSSELNVTREAICQGLLQVKLNGRMQVVISESGIQQIFDVAHNPQAARTLAETLQSEVQKGETFAVVGMLRDKDVAGVVQELAHVVDRWYVAGLDVSRGLTSNELVTVLGEAGVSKPITTYDGVLAAHQAALSVAEQQDRIVVFGSFYTVSQVLS